MMSTLQAAVNENGFRQVRIDQYLATASNILLSTYFFDADDPNCSMMSMLQAAMNEGGFHRVHDSA